MQIQSYRTETVLSNLSNKDTRNRIVLIQKQFYKTIRTTASSSLLSEYVQLDPRSAHTHSHNAMQCSSHFDVVVSTAMKKNRWIRFGQISCLILRQMPTSILGVRLTECQNAFSGPKFTLFICDK